jgi:hypothetical protein
LGAKKVVKAENKLTTFLKGTEPRGGQQQENPQVGHARDLLLGAAVLGVSIAS